MSAKQELPPTRESPKRFSPGREGYALLFAAASVALATGSAIRNRQPVPRVTPPKKAQPLPLKLPESVAKRSNSALRVYYRYNERDGWNGGSGVKISPHLALTAGHIMLDGNPSRAMVCRGSYTQNIFSGLYDSDQITTWTGRYIDKPNWAGDDVAMIKVRSNPQFKQLPVAPISPRQPSIGDTVFFINYGESSDGARRHPNYSISESYPGKNLGYTAKYAGTVIGHYDSQLEVATGLRSYNDSHHTLADMTGQPGSSGGLVANRQGQLIGISTASFRQEVATVGWTNSEYNIRLPAPGYRPVHFDLVQPVTDHLAIDAVKSLSQTPSYC